jgi:hypothetical protein
MMKAYKGSKGADTLIFDLGIKWKQVVFLYALTEVTH